MFFDDNRHSADAVWLPDGIRERWGRHAEGLALPAGQPDEQFLDEAVETARQHLTLSVADHLAAVKKPNGPLFRVVGNMPIDDPVPPPPTDGKRPPGKGWLTEAALLGATRAIGLEVFTYAQERAGIWPQQVAPMLGQEGGNHSGNMEEFGFHSDNAILAREHRAEFIALIGLLNDQATETWLVPVDGLLDELDRRSRSFVPVMEDPGQWKVPFPESFDVGADRPYSAPCAILTRGDGGLYEIAFALYNVRPLSQDASDAIEAVKAILTEEVAKAVGEPSLVRKVVLLPGTLMLMNNFRGLHGRGRIQGRRWAQRIYLNRSLDALQSACGTGPGCRVFDVRKLRHK